MESVKAASDIYAPVAGIVEEINEALNDQPSLLNKDPEGKGEFWFHHSASQLNLVVCLDRSF